MNPIISVIIPVYNVGKYLDACLSSVENQTLEDIEIICIEDCSTDNSKKILLEHAEKDGRVVTLFHETNQGVYSATRDGVLASHGDYIMYLDSDDEYFPETCEKAYSAIKTSKTDILQFGTELTSKDNIPDDWIKWFEFFSKPPEKIIKGNINMLNQSFKDMKLSWNLWNKIYKGEIAREAAENSYDEQIYNYADIYTIFFNFYYSDSLAGITDILYRYRPGIGISWNMGNSLEAYRKSVSGKAVIDGIRLYLSKKPEKQLLLEAINAMERRHLTGCIEDYMNCGLDSGWREEGLGVLLDAYGRTAAPLLAERISKLKMQGEVLKVDAIEKDKTIAACQAEIEEKNRMIRVFQQEREDIINSKTYKLGDAIARPYRAINKAFRCHREKK